MKKSSILFLLLITHAPFAWGANVIVPTLGTEVDPAGDNAVDGIASGSATVAAFNAIIPTVVQNWGSAATTENIVDLADVDIRITTPVALTVVDIANFSTSAAGTADVQWSGTGGQTVTIEFGTWDGASFTADRAVAAAGFTALNFGGAYDTASDQTVTYYNAASGVLSTQTFAGAADSNDLAGPNGSDWFSGHISGSQDIARITLDITRNTGSSSIGFDDVAFQVPEPTSVALGGFGALLFLRRRRAGGRALQSESIKR